jgi:hypothetical protein
MKCEALQRIPHEARGLQGICREKAWYPLLLRVHSRSPSHGTQSLGSRFSIDANPTHSRDDSWCCTKQRPNQPNHGGTLARLACPLPNRPPLDLHWTSQHNKIVRLSIFTGRHNTNKIKISTPLLVAYGTFTVMALNIGESSS